MTDLRKAAQHALEAIEALEGLSNWEERVLGRICDKLRAALAQPDVAEGMVLVPVEPTPEMLAVARERGDHYEYDYEIAADWQAMLAAAPKGGA